MEGLKRGGGVLVAGFLLPGLPPPPPPPLFKLDFWLFSTFVKPKFVFVIFAQTVRKAKKLVWRD